MEDNIFDIQFESNGKTYRGWVNPSDKMSEAGAPVSFHVVLNDVSFGYVSFHDDQWVVNEERPADLVKAVGEQIEKYFQ